MHIYYDHPHEGYWFQSLHPYLAGAGLSSITEGKKQNPKLSNVLAYDRPDVILTHNGDPILVVERTVEVPTGHNVGQRFARVAAAAECRVPSVYFGPYVARKHGGDTEGPRYMNLRLFHAIDALTQVTSSAVSTINWPVDDKSEIRHDPAKDDDMRAYLDLFFSEYPNVGLSGIHSKIMTSSFHKERLAEIDAFIQESVRRPAQYDEPPPSVRFVAEPEAHYQWMPAGEFEEFVVYDIGSRDIRSDPYAGMGILYRYLYVLGEPDRKRGLILSFPNIPVGQWTTAAAAQRVRKDIRLFRLVADGALFQDGFLPKRQL